jgi:hypothetical protein
MWYAMQVVAFLFAFWLVGLMPADAQRCPAGQDQFHNCLSMNPQMRAKQEAWANQPAARQIPGAPHGSTQQAEYRGVNYGIQTRGGPATIYHHMDGKRSSVTMANGRSFTLAGPNNCIKGDCAYYQQIRRR